MSYEYAEIEIMANELNTNLSGASVVSVNQSQWYKKRMRPEGDFNLLVGFTFIGVDRIGKALLFNLENDFESICFGNRLGRSAGWLLLKDFSEPSSETWAAVLRLKGSHGEFVLLYRDPSMQGKVEVRGYAHEVDSLRVYGPEIKSSQFSIEWVQFFCGRHQMPIFELLQEPRYLPGVGKQLSSEILFRANINPYKHSWSLTQAQIKRLFRSIHTVINSQITARGKGIDYDFCVYKREGEKCYICQTLLKRNKVKKSYCYWCETCQSDKWRVPKPVAAEFVSKVVECIGEVDAKKGDSG